MVENRWDPEDYHRHSGEQERWVRGLIGRLRLAGWERVLDIGCGDGKVTAEVSGLEDPGFLLRPCAGQSSSGSERSR